MTHSEGAIVGLDFCLDGFGGGGGGDADYDEVGPSLAYRDEVMGNSWRASSSMARYGS